MGQGSTFWADVALEPKRQFQFLFTIPGIEDTSTIETYLVKSLSKPSITIGTGTNINYLQHTFKYPGRLTWNDIEVTLLDTIRVDDTTSRLSRIIRQSGYIIPDTAKNAEFSFTKRGATNALQKPRITQIDAGNVAEGIAPKPVEEWTLWNAWVKTVNFGSGLDYANDTIINCTLGIVYDWAEYTTSDTGKMNYEPAGGFQKRPES